MRRTPHARSSRMLKADTHAVSPVIGTILMVAITVTLAALVFVLVQQFGEEGQKPAPAMAFDKDVSDGEVDVIAGPSSSQPRDWSDMTVTGCTAPTGSVDAGDELTACSGTVTIVDDETGTVVYQVDFS